MTRVPAVFKTQCLVRELSTFSKVTRRDKSPGDLASNWYKLTCSNNWRKGMTQQKNQTKNLVSDLFLNKTFNILIRS